MKSATLIIGAAFLLLSAGSVRAAPAVHHEIIDQSDLAVLSAPQVEDLSLIEIQANKEAALAKQVEAQSTQPRALAEASSKVSVSATSKAEMQALAAAQLEQQLLQSASVELEKKNKKAKKNKAKKSKKLLKRIPVPKGYISNVQGDSPNGELKSNYKGSGPHSPKKKYAKKAGKRRRNRGKKMKMYKGVPMYSASVVSPYLKYRNRGSRPIPIHSHERVMSDRQLRRFSEAPTYVGRNRLSDIRLDFLRKNGQLPANKDPRRIREALLRQSKGTYNIPTVITKHITTVSAAPDMSASSRDYYLANTLAPPTGAQSLIERKAKPSKKAKASLKKVPIVKAKKVDHRAPDFYKKASKVKLPQQAASFVNKITIVQNNRDDRKRAERMALLRASSTLHRINRKRAEYRKALFALNLAAHKLGKEVQVHHMRRAVMARADADRYARRAAWGSILHSNNLDHDSSVLLHRLIRKVRNSHVRGAARRAAIKRILKSCMTPSLKAHLAQLLASSHNNRDCTTHRGRRRACARHRLLNALKDSIRRGGKNRKAKKLAKKLGKLAKKASKGLPKAGISEKDAAAVKVLLKRIHASINNPAIKARNSKLFASTKQAVASAKADLLKKLQTKKAQKAAAKKTHKVKKAAKKPTKAHAKLHRFATLDEFGNAFSRTFAELESLSESSHQAQIEALNELNAETELEDYEREEPLVQTQARVEAAREMTEELLHNNKEY